MDGEIRARNAQLWQRWKLKISAPETTPPYDSGFMNASALLRHVDEAIFELADYLHAVESGSIKPRRDEEITRDAFKQLASYRVNLAESFSELKRCKIEGNADYRFISVQFKRPLT